MFKLLQAILKELRILLRDKAALAVIFAMPILLVIVITSIQHSSLQMINNNKVEVLVCNRDTSESSLQMVQALEKIGMFNIQKTTGSIGTRQLTDSMHQTDALVAIVIPQSFGASLRSRSAKITNQALAEFGVATSTNPDTATLPVPDIELYYNPVLQESFRMSVSGALSSARQFTENRAVLQALYKAMSNKQLPDSLEQQIMRNRPAIIEIPTARDGSRKIPNATQHNVPAWTIFAMFFIVVALSTNVVKEKNSGSFIRLKTLPTAFVLNLLAKQFTYLAVTVAQVLVIFSLGIFLFPHIGLPALVLPEQWYSLVLVSVLCGYCAVSYGILIGVYARSIEQAIGFGAVSVVILAAIGGIVVPSFAMPASLRWLMMMSPLHWCMEAYNVLFLEAAAAKHVLTSLVPVLLITLAMQLVSFVKLKQQQLL